MVIQKHLKSLAFICFIGTSIIGCGGDGGSSSNNNSVTPIEVVEVLSEDVPAHKIYSNSTLLGSFSSTLSPYQNGFTQGQTYNTVPTFMPIDANKVLLPTAKEDIAQYLIGYTASHGSLPTRIFIADDIFWGGYTLPTPLDSEIKTSYDNLKSVIAMWRQASPYSKLVIAGAPGVLLNPTSMAYAKEIVMSVDIVSYDAYQAWNLGAASPYLQDVPYANLKNIPECKNQVLTGRFILDATQCATLIAPIPTGLIYQVFLLSDDISNPVILASRITQLISNWKDMQTIGYSLKAKGLLSFVVPFGYYWSPAQKAAEPSLSGGIEFLDEPTKVILKSTLVFN